MAVYVYGQLAKKSQSESATVCSAAEQADSVGLNSTTANTLPAVPHETTDSTLHYCQN